MRFDRFKLFGRKDQFFGVLGAEARENPKGGGRDQGRKVRERELDGWGLGVGLSSYGERNIPHIFIYKC